MSNAIRSNWRILCELLIDTKTKLNIGKEDITPITKLVEAKLHANALLDKIIKQSIYRVGNINMKREINAIVNRIEGMRYAIKNKTLNTKTIQPIIADTKAKN